jgi:hypothetical protein
MSIAPKRRRRLEFISNGGGKSDPPLPIPVPAATSMPEFTSPRLRKAEIAQDGHSLAEQAVYDALWNAARPITESDRGDRFIRIGYDRLAKITRLSWVSVKANLRSLQKKLAIDVVASENSATQEGKAYRVYSCAAILERRRRAGLEWVRRTRGVELLSFIAVGDSEVTRELVADERFCTGRGGPGSGGNAYPRRA